MGLIYTSSYCNNSFHLCTLLSGVIIMNKLNNNDLPEFTAEEINLLRRKAREGLDENKIAYYKKCLHMVELYEMDNLISPSDKVKKWLWGIKHDLKEE
jgi:hypothetical protein